MGSTGSSIDELLDSAVERGVLAGVAAIVVDRDGIRHEHHAGTAREDTIYRNASMTRAGA
jgi:hypothetical protein